jgi:hypothetical protein
VDPAAEEPQAPEAIPDPAAEPAPAPVGRACANCGAALADDQEWCLECGTAVRSGRPSLPGWRTGAATVVATVVLASGAVAAAYAAITSEDEAPSSDQIASILPGDPGTTTSAVPQPDPIDIPSEQDVPPLGGAAPTPDASTEVPPPVTPPPASAPITPPAPVYTPPAPVYTPPPATPPTTGTDTNTGSGSNAGGNSGDRVTPVKRAPLEEVPLTPGTTVAAAYNPPAPGTSPTPPTSTTTTPTTPTQTTTTPTDPTQTTTTPPTTTPAAPNGKVHPDTDFTGDPSAAFDGDPTTAWSVALATPELVLEPQAGLLIDLGEATKLRKLVVTPTTPGTTIEVYGSDADTPPATLADKGWKKLATQLDVEGATKITLGKDAVGTDKVRQLLIWFAAGPDDGTSTSVGISELQLYK